GIRLSRAALLARLERWDEAADDYARALDEPSTDPNVLWGALDRSADLFDRMARRMPKDATGWLVRGQRLYLANDLKGAAASFTEATKRDARNVSAWTYLGLIDANRREWDPAAQAFLRALELAPGRRPEFRVSVPVASIHDAVASWPEVFERVAKE